MPARRKPGQRSTLLWLNEQDRERLDELHRLTGRPRTQLLVEALGLLWEQHQPPLREELARLRRENEALVARVAALEAERLPPAESERE
jgi:hypothetical protein